MVVPALLPVTEFDFLEKRDSAHPLDALVRVQTGDNQAKRPSVLHLQGFTVAVPREDDIILEGDVERNARGVLVLGVKENEPRGGLGFGSFRDFFEEDAFPRVVGN